MSRQTKDYRLNHTDFYPTPAWCYENLEIPWKLFNSAHEPGAGDGRIVKFLTDKGIPTTHTEITEGTDFFEWNENVDLILTNPPFSMAQEFIEHSIPRCNTCIMLLRLNFLGTIKRHEFWKQHTPTGIHILSNSPSFTGSGTDATEYAWFIWTKHAFKWASGIHFVPLPTKQQKDSANRSAREALAEYDEQMQLNAD